MTMPSENMSLRMLQLEFIWFSGAAKANNIVLLRNHIVAHKLGLGVAMASNCVTFCGVRKLTRFPMIPRGILRDNHFLRSATTKSFLNNLRKCLGGTSDLIEPLNPLKDFI